MSQQDTTNAENSARRRAVVFACRYCALIGAHKAGRERIALPAFFDLIAVDCAASVEADLILRAFADGFDGVAVLGCHLGGCRHNEANRTAALRLDVLGGLLEAAGLGRDRLLLSHGAAHEGWQFARTMEDFASRLTALPSLRRSAAAPESPGDAS
jgi:F420-non-reducing hydrogenase iron-sulfur subunit